MKEKKLTVCVSGGFDPLHLGHIGMLLGAACFGRLIVILNSDSWLKRKKDYVLIPFYERKEIILAIKGVEKVVSVDDFDGTVCKALEKIKPDIFANGGARTEKNTPERKLCEKLDIKMVWGIGGGEKDQYSLNLRERIRKIGA